MPVYHFTANGLPMNTAGAEATSIQFPAHVSNALGEQESCADKAELFAFLASSKCFHNVAEICAFLEDYCGDVGEVPKVRTAGKTRKPRQKRDVGPDFYSVYA